MHRQTLLRTKVGLATGFQRASGDRYSSDAAPMNSPAAPATLPLARHHRERRRVVPDEFRGGGANAHRNRSGGLAACRLPL